MKIQSEVMADGRIILHLKENDGTPVTSKELSPPDATRLMARWALAVMKAQDQPSIILEDSKGMSEIIISLREKPKPQETEKQ